MAAKDVVRVLPCPRDTPRSSARARTEEGLAGTEVVSMRSQRRELGGGPREPPPPSSRARTRLRPWRRFELALARAQRTAVLLGEPGARSRTASARGQQRAADRARELVRGDPAAALRRRGRALGDVQPLRLGATGRRRSPSTRRRPARSTISESRGAAPTSARRSPARRPLARSPRKSSPRESATRHGGARPIGAGSALRRRRARAATAPISGRAAPRATVASSGARSMPASRRRAPASSRATRSVSRRGLLLLGARRVRSADETRARIASVRRTPV